MSRNGVWALFWPCFLLRLLRLCVAGVVCGCCGFFCCVGVVESTIRASVTVNVVSSGNDHVYFVYGILSGVYTARLVLRRL